ncbi:MAG: flagellar filament capping protein FliD [Gemmatimonadota bacterium]|jgi:flagellar hook-associated protein 2|nr:flagellar filament capping protein FliD [Gemmatimonadota bacterium]
MTGPVSNFSGLASGVQWRDVVDSTLAIDRRRRVTPLATQQSLIERQRTAWTDLERLLGAFERQMRDLRDGSAFGITRTSGGTSPTSGRSLLTATATAQATPGALDVEVKALARAEKVAGHVVASATTALGLAGTFTIAGQVVSIQATDTLEGVRNKVNALNAGATPTRVAASIQQSSSGAFRLVLGATEPGAAGIAIGAGSGGVAAELGFVATQSQAVSSATAAIAAAMGVSVPPPSTIRVGNQVISVDLATDSLTSIAARIRAADVEADVRGETAGGGSAFRLVVGTGVTATSDAGSADVIAALGLVEQGRPEAKEQLAISGALTAGGTPAAGNALLTGLSLDGTPLGLAVGDTITVRGTRGDGTTVLTGITVGAGDTLQALVDRLNAADAFGAPSRAATVSLDADGRLRMQDTVAGESRLAVAFDVQRATGGPTTLGTVRTTVEGRARTVVAGSDARLVIDGIETTSPSNTVASAVPGVTLSLAQAEPGTTVTVAVTRDDEAARKAVDNLVTAYNDIVGFFDRQQAEGQPLRSDPTLRAVLRSLTQAVTASVSGAGSLTRGTAVGLALQRDGRLALDGTAFVDALARSRTDMATLFGPTGIGGAAVTAAQNATRFGTGTIATQVGTIDRQASTLRARIQREEDRLEDKRTRLTEQFTRMEGAVSRLQGQGSFVNSQLAALRSQSR